MRKVVIGYGNTLREDDGIGVLAVEILEETGVPDYVDLLTVQQLTPELSEELAACDRVAFIDACLPGENPPGTIRQIKLKPQPADPGAITHGFNAESLLSLTGMLYGKIPEATLFTITAASFNLTDSLSSDVAEVLPDLLIQINDWIEED